MNCGKRHRRFRLRCKRVGKLPDQDPDDDEDHPEQQALEGRIQPRPPNRLAFKSNTPVEGVRDAKILRHRLPDDPHNPFCRVDDQRQGIPRSERGILRSTRKSCSFFRARRAQAAGTGRPARRLRTASGRVSRPGRHRDCRSPRRRDGHRLDESDPVSSAEIAQPSDVEPDLTWYRQRKLERVRHTPFGSAAAPRPTTTCPAALSACCPGRLSGRAARRARDPAIVRRDRSR